MGHKLRSLIDSKRGAYNEAAKVCFQGLFTGADLGQTALSRANLENLELLCADAAQNGPVARVLLAHSGDRVTATI